MALTDTSLYRAVEGKKFPNGLVIGDKAVKGVLYPKWEDETVVVNGEKKTYYKDVEYDRAGNILPYRGTSLFDKQVFLSKKWLFFNIPKETTIPAPIAVRHTGRHEAYEAEHYQIEVINPMTRQAFEGALDNLARNAIAKACEDARR